MRIVSQQKAVSVDISKCAIVADCDGIIYAKTDNRCYELGKYKSYERAKEVFEDIHKAYAPVYSISNGLTKEQIENGFVGSKNIVANNIRTESTDYYITTYDNYVYYMPEN